MENLDCFGEVITGIKSEECKIRETNQALYEATRTQADKAQDLIDLANMADAENSCSVIKRVK